jgi:hypothetical protein
MSNLRPERRVAAAARCFFSKVLDALEWAPPWTVDTAMKPTSRFSVTICHFLQTDQPAPQDRQAPLGRDQGRCPEILEGAVRR